MKNINDTPRTDELDRELHADGVLADRYSDMRELAKTLEREVNTLERKIQDWERPIRL